MTATRIRNRGFTLIELMIVVILLAIISAFAFPAFQSLIASSRLTAEANELLAGLNLARSEAVRLQRRVVLCRAATSDGLVVMSAASGCVTTVDTQPWQGWAVFVDEDGDGVFDAGETVVRTQAINGTSINLVSDSPMRTAGNRVSFRPDGLARAQDSLALQSGTVSVCDGSGVLASDNKRDVSLASGSRMQVVRATDATCGMTTAVEDASEEAGS